VKNNPLRRAARPVCGLTAVAAAVTLLAAGPDAALAQATAGEQTITITGIRRGIESAINVKKNSDSIVEAISAEDIGKLPDTSIAESIARLPGVAAQRTAGRAQQISIRGLAPDFATALLNGREQVTTGDSRGVEFDQYPSELLSGVVIYKTPDAALVGQGLSGTVDLQTVRPLDFSGRAVAVNYRKTKLGVGLPKEGDGYRFSISYIDQFADRTLGIALGFARLDETGPQTQRFEAWGVADSTFGTGTVKTPGGYNAFLDQNTQKRDGFAGTIHYRPSKTFQTSVDLFRSNFDRITLKQGFQAPIGFSSAGGYDPGGTLTAATVSGGVATSGTFDNFKGVARIDSEAVKDKLSSVGWNTQWKFAEQWTATLDLSTSEAERTGGIVESTAGLPGNGTAVGTISWTGFDGTNVGGASYTATPSYADRGVIRLTDVMGWGGGTALPQAGYSKLPFVKDELKQLRFSGKRDLGEGMFAAADFGVNYTDREKTRAYVEGRLLVGPASDPFAGVTVPGSATLVTPGGVPIVSWDPTGSVGSIYTVAPKLVRDIANKDWTVNEKVTTLYTKWDLDSTLFGLPVRGNVGVQYVRTDQSSRAFNVDGSPCPGDVCDVTEVTDGKTYGDLLPSVNLNFDLGSGQQLRFGLARVLARPTLNDMRASLGFGLDTVDGVQVLKGGAGNPRLDPYRANAIDLSYEKYWGAKAYVGAALFYKQLSSYIVRTDRLFDFAPFITAETPLPTTGPAAGSTIGLLNQPVNGQGGNLRGLELAASMPLNVLAPMLDGFGVQASYSNTSSSVTLPSSGISVDNVNTASIPLPGLSKRVSGLTFYYEKFGFSARVAQRYRSDFVGEVTDIVGDRRLTYIKAERVVDLQLGYEFQSGFAKGLSLLFQANNVGDAEYVRYRDDPSNEVERVKYGKQYLFGINYKL
jgi:iron complex outermembrane receptor protein